MKQNHQQVSTKTNHNQKRINLPWIFCINLKKIQSITFCTISDECPDDDDDTHAALPPPAIHFLRRGSSQEPGSTLMPSMSDRSKGRRHSELELEHEATAPQTPYSHLHKSHLHKGGTHHKTTGHHPIHGAHRARASKKSTESAAPSSIVSIMEDEKDNLEEQEESSKGTDETRKPPRGNSYPKIAINVENEVEKL